MVLLSFFSELKRLKGRRELNSLLRAIFFSIYNQNRVHQYKLIKIRIILKLKKKFKFTYYPLFNN